MNELFYYTDIAMKSLIYFLLCFVSLGLTPLNVAAAPVFIQSGTWIVDSEMNGLPGRGMAIDVQNQYLLMQVYSYTPAGQPTFHLASGPLNNMQFEAPLKQYRGGRFFGSGERVAREESSAGVVRIRFESSTSGFISFPGESEMAISRFKFDGVPGGMLNKPNFRESWMVMEYDASGKPYSPWKIEMYNNSTNGGVGSLALVTSTWYENSSGKSNLCTASDAAGWFKCSVKFDAVNPLTKNTDAVFEIRKTLAGLEGFVIRPKPAGERTKLSGMKYSSFDNLVNTSLKSVHIKNPAISDYGAGINDYGLVVFVPESGTWVVSQELNGKPGRGMAIDVQNDTFVMQVYNYENNGDPSFHLAMGKVEPVMNVLPVRDGASLVPNVRAQLKRYAGGRYFGGPPLSGREVADLGNVELIFESPLKGKVKFPGEGWVDIERYQFGYGKKNPEALLGEWIFGSVNSYNFSLTLDRVEGRYAKGGNGYCYYPESDSSDGYLYYVGSVFCAVNISVNSDDKLIVAFDPTPDVRGVPALSRRMISSFSEYPNKGFAIQTRDKNGIPFGWGRVGTDLKGAEDK